MDLGALNGVLFLVAVVLGVITRFGVYTTLVRFNRWLPEKAAKVANISAISVAVVGIIAVVANMLANR